MKKLIKEVSKALSACEPWVSTTERSGFQKWSKDLKIACNDLEMRKAEFPRAWRIAEEKQAPDVKPGPTGNITPVVIIKSTKLPTLSGCKRDFHHWRTDWESLQKQGEPIGSPDVKKIQLLDSVDDRIVKDLKLSTYSRADDLFRVLANRYGNKLEIVEELENIPPVKGS